VKAYDIHVAHFISSHLISSHLNWTQLDRVRCSHCSVHFKWDEIRWDYTIRSWRYVALVVVLWRLALSSSS